MSEAIDGATNLEKRALRNEYDDIVIAGSPSGDERVLHLPDADTAQPACRRDYNGHTHNKQANTMYRRKDIAVYPRGYKDWCKYCIKLYRMGNL